MTYELHVLFSHKLLTKQFRNRESSTIWTAPTGPGYSDTCRKQHWTTPPLAGLFRHMPETTSDTTSDNSAYGRVIPIHAGNNIEHNIGQLRLCPGYSDTFRKQHRTQHRTTPPMQ